MRPECIKYFKIIFNEPLETKEGKKKVILDHFYILVRNMDRAEKWGRAICGSHCLRIGFKKAQYVRKVPKNSVFFTLNKKCLVRFLDPPDRNPPDL